MRYFADTTPPDQARETPLASTVNASTPHSAFGDWKDGFLSLLWDGFTVKDAAHKLGMTRNTVYRERADCPRFAEMWQVVKDARDNDRIDQADDALFDRHVNGYDKAVTWQGKVTTHTTEYDTTAGKAWLAAHDARYRNAAENTGPVRVVLHLDGMGLVAPTPALENGGGGGEIVDATGSVEEDPENARVRGEEEASGNSPENEGK